MIFLFWQRLTLVFLLGLQMKEEHGLIRRLEIFPLTIMTLKKNIPLKSSTVFHRKFWQLSNGFLSFKLAEL